jgi:hypothetical protein
MADDYIARQTAARSPIHLSEAEIASYLDNVLDGRDRRRIEAHLVRCDVCLNEILGVLTEAPASLTRPRSDGACLPSGWRNGA